MTTTFILDQFDGTGTLADHQDTLGHGYAKGGISTNVPTDYVLDGSGAVGNSLATTVSYSPAYYLQNLAQPPAYDYAVEIDFVVATGSTSADEKASIMAVARDSSSGFLRIDLSACSSTSASRFIGLHAIGYGVIETDPDSAYLDSYRADPGLVSDGPHTLRLEVQGTTLRGYLDGVQYVQAINTTSTGTVGRAGFGFAGADNVFKVTRFEASSSAVPTSYDGPGPGYDGRHFVYDSFTGSGEAFVDHVGELGADWSVKSVADPNDHSQTAGAAIVQDGVGQVPMSADDGTLTYGCQYSSGTSPLAEAFIEAQVVHLPLGYAYGDYGEFELALARTDEVLGAGAHSEVYLSGQVYDNDAHYFNLEITGPGGRSNWSASDDLPGGWPAVSFGEPHIYRVEVTASEVRILCDSALVATIPNDVGVSALGMRARPTIEKRTVFNWLRAGALDDPSPSAPTQFWTLYQGTQEVLE